MEALATWQNRTLCKMTSTHQAKEIRVTIWFVDNNLQFNFAYKPGIPKVRAIKRDTSAAPLDPLVSMVVHGTLMYLNLTFINWYYRTGILIRYVNYLPSINFARYAQPILETVNSRLEAFIHESVFEPGIEKGETHVSPSWKRWDICLTKLRHVSPSW